MLYMGRKDPEMGSDHDLKLAGSCPTLLSYDELPEWHKDNDFIRHGYRPESNSAYACLASWTYLHNETVNIYSHLLPAFFLLIAEVLVYQSFATAYPDSSIGDRLIFVFYLLSAAICLGMSATYHTLMNHSSHVSNLWLRLDYVGIIVLTLGGLITNIYMTFYCEPALQRIYWATVSTLGVATTIILVTPIFEGSRWRTFRLSTFVATGLFSFAPLAHGINKFGFAQMQKQAGTLYLIAEGCLLILGAVFYVTRAPERLRPGRFDYFGCSHQIFHILVVLATIIHLLGIVTAFNYNYNHRNCSLV